MLLIAGRVRPFQAPELAAPTPRLPPWKAKRRSAADESDSDLASSAQVGTSGATAVRASRGSKFWLGAMYRPRSLTARDAAQRRGRKPAELPALEIADQHAA